ncbi:MAG TPA: bifunctional 4-hydroxy-2-oxoglutarate aldolase/2-dehydro-3-deoxy-phosphogluconate aldolase [Rhizomicrobium sp.]|nr:bifunctional 4-hydroxy-2-oxoglutarate aldolase/2-dehydro-3-deoxy-phosphogluconate aldolase [Rhizomicrobium sp.]
MRDISSIVSVAPVIPVLTIARIADAVPLAEALVEGGLPVLEVTLRTRAALDAISAIAHDVPAAVVGAGTVLAAADLKRAYDAGAQFAVSPGFTEELARDAILPLLPGVATASEIMRGRALGFAHFKFFPAESSGGVAALKSFAGPFADIRFCPTGGVTAQTAPAYLALANVACVGGSWMAPNRMVEAGDWNGITALACEAARLRS